MRGPSRVVAIDGPSGVGKSTTAKALARRLGLPYLDTGAMYRSVAFEVLLRGIDPDDAEAVAKVSASIDLELEVTSGESRLLLRGEALGNAIRSPEVSAVTSQISAQSAVRADLVAMQRRFVERFGGVVEGRDIGSVVFPGTPFKFYLDASPLERARRRHRQLQGDEGDEASLAETAEQLAARDRQDREREDSPLRCDASYVIIDSSDLEPEEVLDRMVAHIDTLSSARRGNRNRPGSGLDPR